MTAEFAISAIICTHNPLSDHLAATLASLRCQQALQDNKTWELLIIDNASERRVDGYTDVSWHPRSRIIREDKLGLTYARIRSFHESRGEILVYIDDDNIIDSNYLSLTLDAFGADSELGAIGGKSIPRWETQPPAWFEETGISLACRDLGDQQLEASWKDPTKPNCSYPACAPIGAGLGIRREAYAAYVQAVTDNPIRTTFGRRGTDLSSGEDNDIILSVLAHGWKVAYLPELRLEHIVPEHRVSLGYLERYARSSNRTWVQVLAVHGIRPWAPVPYWSLPLRKARAWVRLRAWKGPVNRIRWCAACGNFDGRATLTSIGKPA
jgi:glycosyltransferase involved in cell wall biosynthesis